MKALIRDNILKIKSYEPGVSIDALRKEHTLDFEREFSRLASNENPLGPSPLAIQAIKKSLQESNLYPDNNCNFLRMNLASHLGISQEKLCIGNGTTELILLLGLTFLDPGDSFIMSESSFIMGKIVSQVMDSNLLEVPLKKYRHDLETILKKITSSTKMIYLDNPMNPIGTMLTHEEISEFMEKIPKNVLVVFDEAYNEYVNREDYPDSLKFVGKEENVVVLRTFSKLYGLAGLRVGYCVTKEEFVNAIKKVSPPFSVNRFAQIAAAAALEDEEHTKKTLEMNESGKRFLCENFKKMSVFYIPSETNFVTMDVKTDAENIFKELQKRNIIVRPLTMYGKPTFLRVTIGTPEQNKRFVDAFKEVY